uniref:Putative secreted protein n=1 Tax=Ixodes ricinus TaxID=34613 RepID=A0A6B0VEW7_IXORI
MSLWKSQSDVLVALIIILLELSAQIAGQGLPMFDGSFYASGEIFRSKFEVATKEVVSSEADSSEEDYSGVDSSEVKVEIELKETNIFEEAYDAVRRKAALRITLDKEVIVFFEDLYTKHKFVLHTFDGYTTCEAANKEDWEDKKHLVTVVRGPDKRKYTFLRDILTLQRRVRVSKTMIQLVRNMSCRTFDLDIRDAEKQYIRPVITWTLNETLKDNSSSSTTAQPPQVTSSRPPLGIKDLKSAMYTPINETLAVPWEVSYTIELGTHKSESMTMRIFSIDFIRQSSVNKLLEIPDGVSCPGNYYKKWLPQPIFWNMRVFCYSARVWNSKTKKVSVIKGWLDVDKRISRLDYTPWLSKGAEPITVIVVNTTTKNSAYDRVYRISKGGSVCEAMRIKDLEFDPQMILKPTDMSSMTTKTFFMGRTEVARLNYTKVTFKGGIPCHLWSMRRDDWPPGPTYVVTLWQWCFINKDFFTQDSKTISSQLVSLDITIEELYYKKSDKHKDYEIGQTFSFYFYNVNSNMDKLTETKGFAPTACGDKNDTRKLRLRLTETSLPMELLREPDFLFAAWRSVEVTGGIPNPRLRITDFKAIKDKEESFLEFMLWGRLIDLEETSTSQKEVDMDQITTKMVYHAKRGSFKFTYNKKEYKIDKVCFI